jgi:hypothetical protein
VSQTTQLLSLLGGVLIPLLVGVLTKSAAPSGVKAILNAALSGLAAAVAQVVPEHFVWQPFLIAWATTWVVSIATHYGLYKPTGVSQAVQTSTGTFGLG